MPIADQLAAGVERFLGVMLPIRLRAWDGSEAGPNDPDTPVLIIRRRRALRRIMWDPNELGMARAYITGDIDVEGDLYDGLSRFWAVTRVQPIRSPLSLSDRFEMLGIALRMGVIGPRPPVPKREAQLSGQRHTKHRDRAAIAHHYDLSNKFYSRLLDKHMAYSCGYWTSTDPGYGIADAQRDKLDLICRKLDLQPGQRLLDVGCGWGSLILYASEHYGVHATGVTISEQQRDFVAKRIADRGLADSVEIRLQDYRDIKDEPFDAIGTIEMGEHVGSENYPTYVAALYRLLRPQGRLLLQQMTRGHIAPGGGAFIESYIAPDMTMISVGRTVDALERVGFEIRDVHALREHYVRTIRAWEETLNHHLHDFVGLAGEVETRIWRLYLAGSALAFAENRMGISQILAVRPTENGASGMPAVRLDGISSQR